MTVKLRQIIRTGTIAAALIGGGYLVGSGTIGDVLNIGESKIGAGSTRADNEEYKAETERLSAEAERLRAESDYQRAETQRRLTEALTRSGRENIPASRIDEEGNISYEKSGN